MNTKPSHAQQARQAHRHIDGPKKGQYKKGIPCDDCGKPIVETSWGTGWRCLPCGQKKFEAGEIPY